MFTESNTVEAYVRDLLCGQQAGDLPGSSESSRKVGRVAEPAASYQAGRAGRGVGWQYAPAAQLPRQLPDVFVEPYVREALLRLNPTIAAQLDRACGRRPRYE